VILRHCLKSRDFSLKVVSQANAILVRSEKGLTAEAIEPRTQLFPRLRFR
jgi:hypothetical protein